MSGDWRCFICNAEGTNGEAGWRAHYAMTHMAGRA